MTDAEKISERISVLFIEIREKIQSLNGSCSSVEDMPDHLKINLKSLATEVNILKDLQQGIVMDNDEQLEHSLLNEWYEGAEGIKNAKAWIEKNLNQQTHGK
jgi:hypothetical protein